MHVKITLKSMVQYVIPILNSKQNCCKKKYIFFAVTYIQCIKLNSNIYMVKMVYEKSSHFGSIYVFRVGKDILQNL